MGKLFGVAVVAVLVAGCNMNVRPACKVDGDCLKGEICFGGGCKEPTYSRCPAAGCRYETCFDVRTERTHGAFCDVTCTRVASGKTSECPPANGFDGACLRVDGNPSLCFQRCQYDTDCVVSSTCLHVVDADGVAARVCLPESPPPG